MQLWSFDDVLTHLEGLGAGFAYGAVDRAGYEAVQSMHVANHLSP